MTALFVMLGAMVGAPLRYWTDRLISARHDSVVPWGTLTVNLSGSFLLGFLTVGVTHDAVSSETMSALGVGLCGGLTTYSTFSHETIRLIQGGARLYAVINIGANVGGALLAAASGALVALATWN
ncbi:MAG: fluoride efflux transporter CrcB [Corynebacteriales bacterium]|nr:fluoride efflux transporter CrcB [Mycobacteriales bacterium]